MNVYAWYFTQRKFANSGEWNTIVLAAKRIVGNVLQQEEITSMSRVEKFPLMMTLNKKL